MALKNGEKFIMVKLEDFSKETLIKVIKQKWFLKEKEFLLECNRIEYAIESDRITHETIEILNESSNLVKDFPKWLTNQRKIDKLFKKKTALIKRFEMISNELLEGKFAK